MFQLLGLMANITLILSIGVFLEKLLNKTADFAQITIMLLVVLIALAVRFFCTILASRMSFQSSASVKKELRHSLFEKQLRLKASGQNHASLSEMIQFSVEGVEQLEVYFGSYLPQFFYAMIAPVILFIVFSFISLPTGIILLMCVPLIPVSLAFAGKLAKKLFSKYWNRYTSLGDSFLGNLQGLTTLKIYQADKTRHEEMNKEAEGFRKITMKVLIGQLNSITIMDILSLSGAALGIISAVSRFSSGQISVFGCIVIILLSAEFFIPMRQLGSLFHVAMNGATAGDKILSLIDIPEPPNKTAQIKSKDIDITCCNLRFAYDEDRTILEDINLHIPTGSLVSVVGESGSGKSTLAGILCGYNKNYKGSIKIGETECSLLSEQSLMKNVTYIGSDNYLFKGTVRENLLIAKPNATDTELRQLLKRANLDKFLEMGRGLNTELLENASNFSGGQRQRLALARALLHDSLVYVVDEATSSIDPESERYIMAEIYALAGVKTVILISHRLVNVTSSDKIIVLKKGKIAESGTHQELLSAHGNYHKMWQGQQQLEQYTEDVQ